MARHIHLHKRGQWWHYRRRVPLRYADLEPRPFVAKALGTSDELEARAKAAALDREFLALWEAMRAGEVGDLEGRRRAVLELAEARGLRYLPAAELARGGLDEILARLERLERQGGLVAGPVLEAELGLAPSPRRTVAEAVERFLELTADRRRHLAPHQEAARRATLLRSAERFVAAVGDVAFLEVTRREALQFRGWWQAEALRRGLTLLPANKDFANLSSVWGTLERLEEPGLGNPWRALRFSAEEASRRPLRAAWAAERWLKPGALDALEAEARAVLLGLVETGLRPSELLGVAPGDVVLEAPVPHLVIRPTEWRALKTRASRREVPLLGCSLEALRDWREGFPYWRTRPKRWSSVVNAALRAEGLLPDGVSVYGLRHDFEDRLTAVDAPERLKADLMGHAMRARPRYGAGPSLEHKAEWLRRIVVSA